MCPQCGSKKDVVKTGIRKTKRRGRIQRYRCKLCSRQFSSDPLPKSNYSPKIIAFALSYYNIGHTLEETQRTIKRKYKVSVPMPTVHDWTRRHEKLCTFIPMRKKYTLDWRTTITEKKLYHQQVFEFKYHPLKTNIAAKEFPKIRNYMKTIADADTRKAGSDKETTKIFRDSTLRCSTFKPLDQPKTRSKSITSNNATKMTMLALSLAKNRASRHEAVEDFFIKNDSKTIAVEVPVYILPKEALDLNINEPLTGHIDLLQFRSYKVYILDYKPDQNLNNTHTQLWLYKRALAARTKIPLEKIKTAAFNENEYVEFF